MAKKRKLKKKIKHLKNYVFLLEQVPTFPAMISQSLKDALVKTKAKLK